ncbi:MAG: pilin [Candidatus Doudnabacteria bacterium]|jgi:hypothetical protein
MKNYLKTLFLSLFVLMQIVSFGFITKKQVLAATPQSCQVLIVFDAQPRTAKADSMLTLSGAVAFSADGKTIGGNCIPIQANYVEIWLDNSGSGDDSIAQFPVYAKLTQDINKKVDFSANWTPANYGHKNGSSVSFYATLGATTGRYSTSLTRSSNVVVTLSASAASSSAGGGTATPPAPGAGTPAPGAATGTSAGGMQSQPTQVLYNPIPTAPDLTSLLIKIMRGFILITGIWAVAFIVIGGFKMVISQGNEEAVAAAKKSIMWSVIGLIVVLLAFSIIAIIQNLIGVDIKEVKTSQIPSYKITQKI